MIALVDNDDSFTWNLVHLFEGQGAPVRVLRARDASTAAVLAVGPRAVILGPGPGRPAEARACRALLRELPAELPVLGVCLGFQVLVVEAGGRVARDPRPVHGRATPVHHTGVGPFAGLPDPFEAGRYHSLRAAELPAVLERVAWTEDGVPMAVRHTSLPRWGVQFHPDSILTPSGPDLARGLLREWAAERTDLRTPAAPAR